MRRLIASVLVLTLIGLFLVWRVDSPRVERLRTRVVDHVVPSFDWLMAPVDAVVGLATDFRSYQKLVQQNADLKRELQQMKAWHEAAVQLEQQNAKLLDLNNLKLDPRLTFITGIVLADSGSPYRQSVLINVGERDGIRDGWPVMDGIGLVGRISGVGTTTSRVILLTDSNSNIPVTIQASGEKAILAGDNSLRPPLRFIENDDLVKPGDRVVSSGDGGVFPPDLLIGQVIADRENRLRLRPSADFERLEYLRVLRATEAETITDVGGLVRPVLPQQGPPEAPEDASPEATDE